jgi:RND family efflux transporter MFP subunit
MMSFTPPGRLAKMIARVGDRVHKGQTLALLDATDFEFRERLAVAGHAQAKSMFEQAKKDLEREEQLKKENVTSVAALERMTNGFVAAKAGMEQAQVNLEMARKGVQDTKLAAPYDGIITKKLRSEGEWVGGGAPVYELYETGDLEISLRVPEAFLRKTHLGKELTILCPSTAVRALARIVRVVPIVQESTRTFEVVAQFTKSGVQIYPGQFVEADLN